MDVHMHADGTVTLPQEVVAALGSTELVCEVHGHTVTLRPDLPVKDPRLVAILASLDSVDATEDDIRRAVSDVRADRRSR